MENKEYLLRTKKLIQNFEKLNHYSWTGSDYLLELCVQVGHLSDVIAKGSVAVPSEPFRELYSIGDELSDILLQLISFEICMGHHKNNEEAFFLPPQVDLSRSEDIENELRCLYIYLGRLADSYLREEKHKQAQNKVDENAYMTELCKWIKEKIYRIGIGYGIEINAAYGAMLDDTELYLKNKLGNQYEM